MDRETRLEFWKKIGTVDPDVITPLINTAFNSNLPKWPSLEQSFITLKKSNGNTVIATDGLSSPFDPSLGHTEGNSDGFGLELYVETDEQITDLIHSYQFNLEYQMALQVANSSKVREILDNYGVITSELYDINVPAEFKNSDGRVGVMLGLTSNDIPEFLSETKIVNIKLLTLAELEYVIQNGAQGRDALRNLFAEDSKTISNLSRKSVL